ncbi:MAG: methyltransferase [Acidobacteria bacterium]|nr:methyltransferase [Acidobacteriota bacterium]
MNDATGFSATQLAQPQCGYRFTADAVALAAFAQAGPFETVLDLCSGCGVIRILLWQRSPFRRAVAVQLDAELAALARSNVAQPHLEDRIYVLQADVRKLDARLVDVPLLALGPV